MLTKYHIERIMDAVDDDPDFIADTVALVEQYADLPRKTSMPSVKELSKLQEVLQNISTDMRTGIVMSHITKHFDTIVGDSEVGTGGLQIRPEHDPVYILMDALDNLILEVKSEEAPDGISFNRATKRQEVSKQSLKLFNQYSIHAGTSDTGAFTNYLAILFEAMGEDFNANNSARYALK